MPFSTALRYALLEGACRLGERNLTDDEGFVVEFLYLGAHLQRSSALSVVISRHVDAAARGEIGVEMELLATQIADGCLTNFIDIMGQDARGEAYGNAVGTLGKKQREFNRQRDRLLVTAVVRQLPLCCLGVEDGVQGEFRQTGLDITVRQPSRR